MIDFFDKLYTSIKNKNSFLDKIKFYSFLRFITRLSINIIIPFYLIITRYFNATKEENHNTINKRVVVSLTTIPERIGRTWIIIELMLRQTYTPDLIILWLSKKQFPSFEKLPKRLLGLRNSGLKIELIDEDIKSHKKYYYSLDRYKTDVIITIDDDILYPSFLIEELIKLYKNYPEDVCCHRAVKIEYINGKTTLMNNWTAIKDFNAHSDKIFFTSGGGTLFPPNTLHPEVMNKKEFISICPFADDVWLNMMVKLNNKKVTKSSYYSELLPLVFFNDKKLSSVNDRLGLNDKQLYEVSKYIFGKYKCKLLDE